ncbi:PREDICTED: uncharacterized protein LOC107163029 [Diuraphis noxia]|uniref:uncharacterized protein LOC107163029 n=1 Tax=Diuraphis noxia TaxID=143948 RepID=UPI0007639B8F|nr:PREDICTED: uncharacterized protein LOC107163029 [Diuraphis noxia]
MFCFIATRACRPWSSIFGAVSKRQGLKTLSSLSAAQSQSGMKKRVQRRKPAMVEDTGQRQGYWCVTAFSTAEEFRLEQLSAALSKTNMYEPTCLYSGSDDTDGERDHVLKQFIIDCVASMTSGVFERGNPFFQTMNTKINHCLELVELLSHHLSDKHHIRLEWMIIVLIMVEVGFEIIHYAQLFIK